MTDTPRVIHYHDPAFKDDYIICTFGHAQDELKTTEPVFVTCPTCWKILTELGLVK